MATTTNITVSITAVTANFAKGMGRAATTVTNFAKTVSVGTAKIGAFGGALTALVGGAGFTALIKGSYDSIDALAKTSDKLGVTTEELAGLRHAAELSGVSAGTLDMALQRMTRRIAEAAVGTGEAKAAIAELGLSAESLQMMGPSEAFREIASAMQRVEGQSSKIRLAFKLFDSEGVALVNTLAQGREGLDAMQEEAEKLGIAISRVDAARIEMANDAVSRMRAAVTGLTNTLAIQLAPIVTEVAERFVEWLNSMDFSKSINAMAFLSKAVGFVANYGQVLGIIWGELRLIVNKAFAEIVDYTGRFVAWLEKLERRQPKGSTFFAEWEKDIRSIISEQEELLNKKWIAPDASNQVDRWIADLQKSINQRANMLQIGRGAIDIPAIDDMAAALDEANKAMAAAERTASRFASRSMGPSLAREGSREAYEFIARSNEGSVVARLTQQLLAEAKKQTELMLRDRNRMARLVHPDDLPL